MNQYLVARSQIVKRIRHYFDEQGFLEIHTPRLVGLPGQEPYLEPLWSEIEEQNGAKHRGALITSPEYAMKKLLAAGFEKIYDLGPCFRNSEPWDGTHDVEFLMIEWYRREAGLKELFEDTEGMVKTVAKEWFGCETGLGGIPDRGWLNRPFRRLTVAEAMKQYAKIDLDDVLENKEALARLVVERGMPVAENDTWDDLFFRIFLVEVEPYLGWSGKGSDRKIEPTFLYNYPASMAALARKDSTDPRYALRTELYFGDLELANGFAELSSSSEQRMRFEEEQALRQSLGKEIWPIDERFIECLPKMGDAAGIAFGVDRLVMALTGAKSISDIMPIPIRERFEM
ncbi:EF-P lysine aminoacylase GenX [Patescibacteria group bacterium]|nr:EF-P lysine aminoacylase GenX [Patescibacteria group bacterium]